MEKMGELKSDSFLMFIIKHEKYFDHLKHILNIILHKHSSLCYVTLGSIYNHLVEDFKEMNLKLQNVYFIDVLSSYYKKKKSHSSCIYLDTPDVKKLLEAASKFVSSKKCEAIVFDNIFHMLKYVHSHQVLLLTNQLKSNNIFSNTKKIFLLANEHEFMEEESLNLKKDLELFADHILEL